MYICGMGDVRSPRMDPVNATGDITYSGDSAKDRWKAHAKKCEAILESSGIDAPPRGKQMTPSPRTLPYSERRY